MVIKMIRDEWVAAGERIQREEREKIERKQNAAIEKAKSDGIVQGTSENEARWRKWAEERGIDKSELPH